MPFYTSNGQLKDSVQYNQYYGYNDMSVEEFEDTKDPYDYLKISTRNGEVISTSTVRPQQAIKMLS